VPELLGKMTPDNIYYALSRHIEQIDQVCGRLARTRVGVIVLGAD
jgi:hypothetical protein